MSNLRPILRPKLLIWERKILVLKQLKCPKNGIKKNLDTV